MRVRTLSALGSVTLLSLAACGTTTATSSGPASPSAGSSSSSSSAPSGTGAVLAVAKTSLGPVLVDARGRTVYLLTADKPGHSSCDATCLRYWPAVAAPASVPASLAGVTAKVASTASMTGGRLLTAGGWPLYTFVKDTKPGDVTGQGVTAFGGTWYAVSPSGQPVKAASSPTPSPSSKSGRGGYGY